jgi:hypothetical protein
MQPGRRRVSPVRDVASVVSSDRAEDVARCDRNLALGAPVIEAAWTSQRVERFHSVHLGSQQQGNEGERGAAGGRPLAAYFASSQSRPTPTSTSSGGSSR